MNAPRRILLIGGHGKVALLTSPLLVADGDQVDAVIRDQTQADDVRATGAVPIVADVESMGAEALADLIAGHDVVIWSAGAGGGNPERTYAVDRDAAIRSVDAAERTGVAHYVMVSYFGARLDHGVDPEDSFYAYAEAKAAADVHVRASGLTWTIVAPSRLTLDEPTGGVQLDGDAGQVSRADVAAVIAGVCRRGGPRGVTIRFNAGDVPIDEALDSLTATGR